jgi:hypothetical protein
VLYKDASTEFCSVVADLDIINGVTGGSLRLSNRVVGMCDLYVEPNQRVFDLVSVKTLSCGSKLYKGINISADGATKFVELVDHRQNICEIVLPNLLILQELDANQDLLIEWKLVNIFSHNPVDPDRMICMAHWTGYKIDENTNTCVKQSRSGCSNPYRFTSLRACQDFYNL